MPRAIGNPVTRHSSHRSNGRNDHDGPTNRRAYTKARREALRNLVSLHHRGNSLRIVQVDRSIALLAALKLFAGVDYLNSFSSEQVHTLGPLALRLHGDGYVMGVAGICYLLISFSHFLVPAVSACLFPILFVPVFVAELSLALWLTVKGVDTKS